MTTTTLTAKPFTPARRLNYSLTASLEKRILEHLAHHAPRWLTSDQLTLLGLAAQIGAGIFYALARYNRYSLLLVILCLALNWLGDSLDGTLARVRSQQRPRFGFYVDHIVDCFGAVALMSGLACSGFLHWPIAIAMLVAFLLLSAESYLATYTLSCFKVFGHRFLLFDIGGIIASVCMFAAAIALTLRHTAQLYREEPLP